MKQLLFSLIFLCAAFMAFGDQEEYCEDAAPCNHTACDMDVNCACSGDEPLTLAQRPQIIYLTFDDALTQLHHEEFFEQLFDGAYVNPNGCPIRGTFFLTHRSCDYSLVNLYYSQGHEMASHSITHRNDQNYWKDLDAEGWRAEVADMRLMIEKYGLVPQDKVVGMRAPFLQGGGDKQFEMMAAEGFQYDSSMPSLKYGYMNLANGRWPHSFDYASTMDCQIEPCPTCSYPGVWSQPILDLEDQWYGSVEGNDTIGSACSMLDSCDFVDDVADDPEEVYDMLMRNFLRSYNGETRAPLGYYVHAAWFTGADLAWRFEGYRKFIDTIVNDDRYADVWIVPVAKGLEYMRNPVPKDELEFYEPFGCFENPSFACSNPRNCKYNDVDYTDLEIAEIYMKSCDTCPPVYPWLGNPNGDE